MMYVIHTRSGCELSCAYALKRFGYEAKVPEKIMCIRRNGEWKRQKFVVFAGYIFLDNDLALPPKDYYRIRSADGVINFLGKGSPQTVTKSEKQYIDWLWNNGKPIEPSKVFVTGGGQKMILSGPLKNFSGNYADIDVRQKRAKVLIPICGTNYSVTLPIEVI